MSNTNYPSRRFHPLTPSDFFRGMLGSKMADDFFEKGWLAETSSMRADLKEAELPGFKKEDISVEYQDGRLLVSAKKDEETKEEKQNYIKRERYYGEVSRRFRVAGIKEQDISAEYKEGILKVTLPKSEINPETSKKIDIR
jgi:HSP20 family protein